MEPGTIDRHRITQNGFAETVHVPANRETSPADQTRITASGTGYTHIVLVDSLIRILDDRKRVEVDLDGLAGRVETRTRGQYCGDVILVLVSIHI